MAAKKKKPPVMESVAASEHATEGETKRKVIELPGMVGEGVEKPHYPELDGTILDFIATRDKITKLREMEKLHRETILAFMAIKGLGSYAVDDHVVVRKSKSESIKVVALADYTGDPSGPEDDGEE